MRASPRLRRWFRRACFASLAGCFGVILLQDRLLGPREARVDPATLDALCGLLFFPAAIGLMIVRRPPGLNPARGGEMGAYRGPTPPR